MFGSGSLAILLALAASGCASASTAANVTEVRTETGETSVLVGDPELQEVFRVLEGSVLTRRPADTGILEAQVTLVSLIGETIRFEYRWEWYDADGFEISKAAQHWASDQIYGRAELPLKAASPSPTATTFRIHVRRPVEMK